MLLPRGPGLVSVDKAKAPPNIKRYGFPHLKLKTLPPHSVIACDDPALMWVKIWMWRDFQRHHAVPCLVFGRCAPPVLLDREV